LHKNLYIIIYNINLTYLHFRPEKEDRDKTPEINAIIKDKLNKHANKLGKKTLNVNDKENLYQVIKDISRGLEIKADSDVKDSVFVKPMLEKFDHLNNMKLLDLVSGIKSKKDKVAAQGKFNYIKLYL